MNKRLLVLFLFMCMPITWVSAEVLSGVLSGVGDDFVEIEKPQKDMPALLLITGNDAERFFV